jgi:NodT family efflux transporter outer membrane factor (OMF) lipoprotein
MIAPTLARASTLTIAILFLLITACSPHKIDRKVKPSVTTPENYSQSTLTEKEVNNIEENRIEETWWHYFERTQLSAMIEQSLENNQDVARYIARIEQARALQRSSRSELLPSLDLEASATESRRDQDQRSSSNEAGATLSWEIDLFKGISSTAKAEKLRSMARVEELQLAKLSLSTEVANAYFGAVAAHNNLQVLNQQLDTDNKLLSLAELRQQSGLGTRVEILQQASRVADSQSLIPLAEAQLRIHENRLDVLLGQVPDGRNRVDAGETLLLPSQLPRQGIPANLLLKRPDLRAAQAELIAADADIAAAIAERLPKLTLDGSYLYSDTGSGADPLAILTGSFVLPLLDWGKRRAMVKRNKAIYSEKLAEFTQRYLLAIEEVENTLYEEGKQGEYVQLLEKRRELLQNTVEETEARYTQGVSDYLPVLNALQELRSVERDLVTEQLKLVNLRITLHRALGGSLQLTEKQETR